jgi:pimeloyl-ACP methyl ester carboxylesterase
VARWLKITLWSLGAIVVAAALFVGFLFLPIGDPDLSSHPDPATSYQDAVTRIDAVRAREDGQPLQHMTRSIALLHGSEVTTSVVVFHGYTHSPYQWRVVAKAYYDRGYNVWIPLAPYHGYADRMTSDLSRLTPQILRDYADDAVDIGRGLGRNVEVVGLSSGGDAAVWTAAERPDVAKSIAIAPVMDPKGLPAWALLPIARWYRYMPDNFNWWVPDLKDKMPGPAYPRFSFRGTFAFIQLSEWARAKAARESFPAKGLYEIVANYADKSVDTTYNVDVARSLAPPDRLTVFAIPASLGFGHDLVEPDGENKAIISKVYPVLSRALGIPLPDPRAPGSTPASETPAPIGGP